MEAAGWLGRSDLKFHGVDNHEGEVGTNPATLSL